MTDPAPHLFWISSRAAGSAALVLTSLSVAVGLLSALRMRGSSRGPELRALHEALALAGVAAIGVHGVLLLGDSYLRASLADIAIPLVGHYRSGWTSAGIVAGWSLILLGPSYYLRGRVGAQRWRKLHRLAAPGWALGLAHSLGEGTDAGQLWFLAMCATVVVPAVLLLGFRWLRPSPKTRQRQHESRSPERRVRGRDRPAVRLGHGLDDREPQPRTAP